MAAVQALLSETAATPLADVQQQRSRQATAKFATGVGKTESFAKGQMWLGRAEAGGGAVGFSDDRHVVTLAGSRSGKGTSAIIPNLIEYPGSVICIDPKGENATVTAKRRANGSAYAFGMGQRVVVLDPFVVAEVPDDLRGGFNPLDLVEVDHLDAIDRARTIADALVVLDDPKDMHWAESAKQLLAALVLFAKLVGPEDSHHLGYVRTLLTRGFTVPSPQDGAAQVTVSGFDYMLQFMRDCEACGGVVAAAAENLLSMGSDERGSVLSFARRNTVFLDSPRMQQCLQSSSFSLADLKSASSGLSLYLCLPVRELHNHGRWLRLIVMLGLGEMERLGHKPPATGHPVLFLLDEFASLGYMRPVEAAAAYIAGYGVKLWLILQDLQQLQGLYEKAGLRFSAMRVCFRRSATPTNLRSSTCPSVWAKRSSVRSLGQARSRARQPNPSPQASRVRQALHQRGQTTRASPATRAAGFFWASAPARRARMAVRRLPTAASPTVAVATTRRQRAAMPGSPSP